MSDLIRRHDAIDALEKVAELYPWRVPGVRDSYSKYNEAWNDALDRAESEIEALPSAQPEDICSECDAWNVYKNYAQPQRTGRWIRDGEQMIINLENARKQYAVLGYPHRKYLKLECSVCKKITLVDSSIKYEFCPHCGADMRGEHDDE